MAKGNNNSRNNRNSSKPGWFKRLCLKLGPVFSRKVAIKSYGLIALILVFVVTANVLASYDSHYALGSDQRENYVWFQFEKDADKIYTPGSSNKEANVWFQVDKENGTFEKTSLDSFRPEYIPVSDFLQLLEIRKAVKGMKIWDSSLFDRLLSALDKNPSKRWVESIQSIERCFPSYVHIYLKLREPYAIVAYKGADYFVDRDQLLLPIKSNTRLNEPLVRIEGINSAPPVYGEKWEGEFITDAIGLMKMLQQGLVRDGNLINLLAITTSITCEPAYVRIEGFKKPKLTLMLFDSCELVWDIYSPVKLADGKAGNATKLRNLSELIFMGKIEDLKKVKRIDLSSEDSIVTYHGPR